MAGILYIIIVCIAAYGVVSRGLFMYNDLNFTFKSVFANIFYRPYWFLYSVVEDETKYLDGKSFLLGQQSQFPSILDIISSNTSTSIQKTEATATHILLSFHMLFINILILNLLIAVFKHDLEWWNYNITILCLCCSFSINDVQARNEYLWRHQRYQLISTYFQKPPLAFPPIAIIGYIFWLINVCCGGVTFRVFSKYSKTVNAYTD